MDGIWINQAGYLPDSPKICYSNNPEILDFAIQTIDESIQWKTVFSGRFEGDRLPKHGDFSAVRLAGDYRIIGYSKRGQEDDSLSDSFVIMENAYSHLCRLITGFFTLQRCGSAKGWAGCCHQAPVPLVGTGRNIDVRGGYHQSGDLRCWADGVSCALLGYFNFACRSKPPVGRRQYDEELRWGADYFLKLVSPEGFIYDSQFVPIGWGPRDYYNTPAPQGAHYNICTLLALLAEYFYDNDPEYAKKCLENAEKVWTFILENPRFDHPYSPPVENLPPGTQGKTFYFESYRGSASMLCGEIAAALALHHVSQQKKYFDKATQSAVLLLELQIKQGKLKGFFRESPQIDNAAFSDCSYVFAAAGPRVLVELLKTFPEAADAPSWRQGLNDYLNALIAAFAAVGEGIPKLIVPPATPPPGEATIPYGKVGEKEILLGSFSFSTLGMMHSLLFSESTVLLKRPELLRYAQYCLDYFLGANPKRSSYITGVGYRHIALPIYGQFFPSTPFLPGGVVYAAGGEYDLPAAGMMLWAITALTLAEQ